MTEEVVFAVDKNDKPLRGIKRSEVIRKALWRRSSGGIVIDPARNVILTHKRSETKDERPNFWVCTFGGKVQPQEKSDDAAKRELSEEFGVESSFLKISYYRKWKSSERRQFEYLFYIFLDSESCTISHDPEEVAQHQWMSIETVLENLKTNELWYSYGYEIEMIKHANLKWENIKDDPKCDCELTSFNRD